MTRILVSNDDGYRAEGIRALVRSLAEWAEVLVVAPDRERSGSGHAITLDRPLRLRSLFDGELPGSWHLVDGTPTDCVNLGLHVVCAERRPDLVVSGINHGVNLGNDVTYSGTVGGALEAQSYGVPALALSQRTDGAFDFESTARFASRLARKVLEADGLIERAAARHRDRSPLFNVNFPIGDFEDVAVTRLGRRTYRDSVALRSDPRGREYYWIAGSPDWAEAEGTDVAAVLQGKVSLTPLSGDLTQLEWVEALDSSPANTLESSAG